MATACWCCCVYDPSPPTSYPHTPPPQWMTKKKIPFLISSDRAWPRLPWEGSMVAWWGLLRPQGNMMGRRGGKKKGATSTIRSQTRRSRMPHGAPFRLPSLVSTVADGDLTGGKKNVAHGDSKRIQHTALRALMRRPQGVISFIQHWSTSYRGLTHLLASKLRLSQICQGPVEEQKVHQARDVHQRNGKSDLLDQCVEFETKISHLSSEARAKFLKFYKFVSTRIDSRYCSTNVCSINTQVLPAQFELWGHTHYS